MKPNAELSPEAELAGNSDPALPPALALHWQQQHDDNEFSSHPVLSVLHLVGIGQNAMVDPSWGNMLSLIDEWLALTLQSTKVGLCPTVSTSALCWQPPGNCP
jgi:hypothetical protein